MGGVTRDLLGQSSRCQLIAHGDANLSLKPFEDPLMHAMVLSRIGGLLTFTEMPDPIPGARRGESSR